MSWGVEDRNHLLLLSIEKFYSLEKKGFLLIQHYVQVHTLNKVRYDVYLGFEIKWFKVIVLVI